MIKLHFLNVGHGDCIIIDFVDNGRTMVVDINRSDSLDRMSKSEMLREYGINYSPPTTLLGQLMEKSFSAIMSEHGYSYELEDPIEYIKMNNINSIFRFIVSHPHMDHITGIKELCNLGIANTWIVDNSFIPDKSKLSENQISDWEVYEKLRSTSNSYENGIKVIRPFSGDSNEYWREDGIFILSPNEDIVSIAHTKNNPNIMSYVILIVYHGFKVILGGDAEEDTWKYIVDNYSELINNIDILKASHHGRESGYYQPAVKIMNPTYTIVSVGKKPATDASNKYRNYSDYVWSTRWKGNICFELNDDGTATYYTQRN